MPIRTIEDNGSLREAINNFDREIKNLILIEIINKIFSFTLEYQKGKLISCDSKQITMEKAFNISSYGIPIQIDYDGEESILIYGFVYKNENGEEVALVTDFSMSESKVILYNDRLNVLTIWGFKTAEYLESHIRTIISDVGDINKYRLMGKQLMIIPNYQVNNNMNNWPIIIK